MTAIPRITNATMNISSSKLCLGSCNIKQDSRCSHYMKIQLSLCFSSGKSQTSFILCSCYSNESGEFLYFTWLCILPNLISDVSKTSTPFLASVALSFLQCLILILWRDEHIKGIPCAPSRMLFGDIFLILYKVLRIFLFSAGDGNIFLPAFSIQMQLSCWCVKAL